MLAVLIRLFVFQLLGWSISGFHSKYLGPSSALIQSSRISRYNENHIVRVSSKDLPSPAAERFYRTLRHDSKLRGLVLLPKLAFTPEEHDFLMSSIFDGCDFELLPREHIETAIAGSRFFSLLPFLYDQNIVINLRLEPQVGRNDIDILPSFYKYILKHRDILESLAKQDRLGKREDLDHVVVFHYVDSHPSNHMITMPLRHPVNKKEQEEQDEVVAPEKKKVNNQ